MLTTILFYLFSGVTVISALAVISARNPVYSVLFLILAFFNAAGLFVLLGAEFLAMILVIVYVGAVAVLFLFVVMMLNINLARMKEGFLRYLPIGAAIAVLLFLEIFAMVHMSLSDHSILLNKEIPAAEIENTRALGQVLYTDYVLLFQISGIILLVAMIGAIVLTHRQRDDVRRQNIASQLGRDPKKTVKLVKVKSGEGVK